MVNRYIYLNSFSSSHPNISCKCPKPGMIRDMTVIYVFALSYFIVKWFFVISQSQKWNDRNGDGNLMSHTQFFILSSQNMNNVIKIEEGVVRFIWYCFKHP